MVDFIMSGIPDNIVIEDQRQALADLAAENGRLRELLREAVEDIESWAGYASEYFQDKHDLAGCLARYRAALGVTDDRENVTP
jgi:hypothetical protein